MSTWIKLEKTRKFETTILYGLINSPRIGHITHTNRHSSKIRYFARNLERNFDL